MTYKPRTAEEINSIRRAAILSGKPVAHNGACHYCLWPFHAKAKEVFCSGYCRDEYAAEVRQHGPA